MRKLSVTIGMIAIAMYASADVRNIRPPITGEGKLGTTTYKWGEVNAVDGYYSNLILGGLNITNKFLSPYDGEAGEVFYANGLGGGVWGAASSPTNGISQAVAESLFATAAQGAKADAALPKDGSSPMTGDIDMDGYDLDDVGTVNADRIKMTLSGPTARIIEELPLVLSVDAKCGYSGSGDYIGAADGVGFYCVESTYTNNFSLDYITTNNYIMIQSPLIATTSNLIEKITGYGLCTSDNDPVPGLSVGDHYVTFAHTGSISRTNLVTYSRFGSTLAEYIPQSAYCFSSASVSVAGYLSIGGLTRTEEINIFSYWSTDMTAPLKLEITSTLRADYPIANFIDLQFYNNTLVMFGLYHTNSLDSRRLEPRYFITHMRALSKGLTITQ